MSVVRGPWQPTSYVPPWARANRRAARWRRFLAFLRDVVLAAIIGSVIAVTIYCYLGG